MLNVGQRYYRVLQGDHSAILSTAIKLPLGSLLCLFLSDCFTHVLLYMFIFQKDCGNPPEPDNGDVELQSAGVTTYGARATQSCNTGYDTTGTTTIECMATGSWSAGPVQCIIKSKILILMKNM